MDVLGILCLGFMAIYFINGCRNGFFINLIESIEETKSAVVAGAKLFGEPSKPAAPAETPTTEPPKEGA